MIQKLLRQLEVSLKDAPSQVTEVIRSYMWEYDGNHYGYYNSFMKERFHPAAKADFLPALKRDIDWFVSKTSHQFPSEHTPSALKAWLELAKKFAGVVGVKGFVLTSNKVEEARRGQKASKGGMIRSYYSYHGMKSSSSGRKTCRADFVLKPHRQLVSEGTPFSYYPDRKRAIKFLAKLEGRLHVWKDGWLTAHCLPIAKTGLVSVLVDQFVQELCGSWENLSSEFPATYALLVICGSVFSERKEFTLQSQKQGALNKHMLQLLSIVRETEPAGLKVVALFLPTWEVFSAISVEDATMIYQTSMVWLNHMATFLQEQWMKGYDKCTRRLCRTPPRGSKINSSGLNAVADAWMNLRRFQTVSAKRASIEGAPLILKVMQLIADDQFRMGSGTVNPNANVFKAITSAGILPWHAVLHPESFDTRQALTAVLDAVRALEPERAKKSSVDSWIGIAKIRVGEVSKPVDMICGCAVPPMSEESADFLREAGIFGAGPWTGT